MATISGKRFQITDGASTPTNLFPYTVTEAVYGLSTVIENAKTAVTSVLSAVTLNGVSKAGTTASFYAPTAAGTTGQILKATTSGAPVWTSAALGASNKPIYLNSSGVLTEGVSCLPLTGGTLSTNATTILNLNRTDGNDLVYIGFQSNGTSIGAIGFKSTGVPSFLYSGTENTIWHAGNDGSGSGLDADLFDGLESSSFFISNGNRGAIDFSTNYKTGYEYVSGSATNGGTAYAILFTATYGDAGMQVNFGRNTAMSYRNRASNSQWSSWRTVYDTANANLSTVPWACSTLTASGNIAANAGITLANDNALGGLDTGGTRRTLLSLDSGNGVYLALGAAAAGYDTHISGNNVSIRYGTSHAIGIYLNSSANVGIGTATPSYRLDVSGSSGWTGRFAGTSASVWIANSDGPGIYIGSKSTSSSALIDARYGQTTLGSGGTSAFYVRADGRVGIGTTSPGNTLEVNGSATCGASGVAGSLFIRRAYDGNDTYMIGSKGASGADGYTLQITNSSGTGATMTLLNGVLTMGGSIVSTGDQVVSSDATLKTNLTPVNYSVADIAKARAVEFDWRDGRGHSMGSIAQDWLGIAPALVHGEEGNMSLAYGQLALVNTILLARQSESHEERIAKMEKENAELKEEVKRLRMN